MDFINGDKIIVSGTSVSKTRNYDRSNRIYLTLDLNLNEVIIRNLKNFKKITNNEILDEFGYDLLEDNENKAKEFLSEKIIRNDTDLIISNAICNLSDILSIEKFINSANKSIDLCIYRQLKEGKNHYSNRKKIIEIIVDGLMNHLVD